MNLSALHSGLPQAPINPLTEAQPSANALPRVPAGTLSGEDFAAFLRNQVNALYHQIANDERHRDVVILLYEEIKERRFGGWTMGQVNLTRLNTSIVLKYSETHDLDPYAVSGSVSLALLEELMATASIIGRG